MQEAALCQFPYSAQFTGYVRSFDIEGETYYSLFDCDGVAVCTSPSRSVPFFFAAEHEVTVLQRH